MATGLATLEGRPISYDRAISDAVSVIVRSVSFAGEQQSATLSIRCPGCRREVILGSTGADRTFGGPNGRFIAGQRLCPNRECRTHVFVLFISGHDGVEVIATYPPERIDFDATGLPRPVIAAFEEAVTCHSNQCWVAAAMMVRKTLEELCRDRNAKGKDLFKRLEALKDEVMLPPALLDGLDALRLLGNDAAHVESRAYEQVGKEEVEIGMAVAQEILKATYQMDTIVARLTALQRMRAEE